MADLLQQVISYHQSTRHHFSRYARGPGYMDWASQPNPFRRYRGAKLIRLDKIRPDESPVFDQAFSPGAIAPLPLDRSAVSRILFDSLALSAWKSAGGEPWALRVNPSSGNLHPTEGYLIAPPIHGLSEEPAVFHYAPLEHGLELRATLPMPLWKAVAGGLPPDGLLFAFSSIHWRESWKYGERAYRYCQLDVGHALAALGIAAAGIGWESRLLDDLSSDDLARLIGLYGQQGPEAETAECLVALYPRTNGNIVPKCPDPTDLSGLVDLAWLGKANVLSPSHRSWPAIDAVARACRKPTTTDTYRKISGPSGRSLTCSHHKNRSIPLRKLIHQRRSAVDMDGTTSITREVFYSILASILPFSDRPPFNLLPWPPQVHLALFVHRVEGLQPGIYMLVRDLEEKAKLKRAMDGSFLWHTPEDCPNGLGLYLLIPGDARNASSRISCHQSIAGDGCFSAAMIAAFESPLVDFGHWFYPRLHWECGMIGQVLYLEAEAASIRGTGIGCFFDDPTHNLLGLNSLQYRDLYHFTAGGPVEDPRLTTLPPYPD